VDFFKKFKKNIKQKQCSKIDAVMLFVFLGLLFIPMSNFSDADKSLQENRALANYKPLWQDGRFNRSYSLDFEKWFNDRFFGRKYLLDIYYKIKYTLAPLAGNRYVLVGKDGWLFYKMERSLDNFANRLILSPQKMQQNLLYLKAIDAWCRKNGKEFYYVIVPDKNMIYGEYYRFIKKEHSSNYGVAHQFYNYIKENSDIKAVYLYDALMENKDKGLLFYKQDTHWSHLGAYYGYKSLMKLMDIPTKSFEFEEKPFEGNLYRMLGSNTIQDNSLYKTLKIKDTSFCKFYEINAMNNECFNSNGTKNVFMLRDSCGGALLYYLSGHFHKIYTEKNTHVLTPEDLEKIESDYDIVIFEVVERFIPMMLDEPFYKRFKE